MIVRPGDTVFVAMDGDIARASGEDLEAYFNNKVPDAELILVFGLRQSFIYRSDET